VELSRDLCLILEHFAGDHLESDTRTPAEKREIRRIAESYLKDLSDGKRDEETLMFAECLATAILRTGRVIGSQNKRAGAILRAIGLSGHAPTVQDELAYDVMLASAFGINEDQVIREYQDAGKIDRFKGDSEVNPANIKKAIRRSTKRK
jgi:hypothetical protein